MIQNFKENFLPVIIVLTLFAATPFFAQNRVSGSILDSNQKKLPDIPVILVSSTDSLSSQYSLTDSGGMFRFEVKQSGNYFIHIKASNFNEYKSPIFHLDVTNDDLIDVPIITLQESAASLEEVVITGKKRMFTQKTDRLVFNVGNSLASQGGDAIDALKNTPLIKVNETSISMIGKSGLNVLINDRPIALTGEALISYLSTISNERISKIEIITTPPAKYAAEGNSGLINIILKKNPNFGWNGSLASTITQRTYFSNRNNMSINYQTEKFSFSSNLLYNNNKIEAYERNQNLFSTGFFSNNRQDKINVSKDFAPSFNLNYKFNHKVDLSLVYEYNGSDFTSDDRSRSLFYDGSLLKNDLLNKGYGTIKSDFHRIHSSVTYKLDSIGKSAEFGFQWLTNKVENQRQNEINNNETLSATQNFSLNKYRLGVSNVDFDLSFNSMIIRTGARYTFLDNNSDVRFFDIASDGPVVNPALTNKFNYKEDIWAFYISSEIKLGSKWIAQGGLRYENTGYIGKSQADGKTIERNYGNFFPTFYMNYKHSEESGYSFRYSKRVDRPRLEQLNPFQWFVNPFQYVEGNPLLNPSFSDNFELTYSNNSNLSATLYHSITKGQVSYVSQFLDDGKIERYSYYNLLDVYQYGIFANYSFTKIKNLEFQFSGSSYWQKTKSDDTSLVPSTKGMGANFSINATRKFGNSSSAQLNYGHNFPSFNGTLETNAFDFLTLGYKTSFFAKQFDIGVTVSTIISKHNEIAYKQVRSNAILNGQNEYDYKSVRLNLIYKFGNRNVKGSKRKNEAEETARIK